MCISKFEKKICADIETICNFELQKIPETEFNFQLQFAHDFKSFNDDMEYTYEECKKIKSEISERQHSEQLDKYLIEFNFNEEKLENKEGCSYYSTKSRWGSFHDSSFINDIINEVECKKKKHRESYYNYKADICYNEQDCNNLIEIKFERNCHYIDLYLHEHFGCFYNKNDRYNLLTDEREGLVLVDFMRLLKLRNNLKNKNANLYFVFFNLKNEKKSLDELKTKFGKLLKLYINYEFDYYITHSKLPYCDENKIVDCTCFIKPESFNFFYKSCNEWCIGTFDENYSNIDFVSCRNQLSAFLIKINPKDETT